MNKEDVILSCILSVLMIVLFLFFYHRIFTVTFDETFARACGLKASVYNGIIASLTAITVVLGMKMMGALLISSLIIFPAMSAMRIFKTFYKVIILSAILSCFCFVTGLILAFYFDLPTGATVVCMNILVFLICTVKGKIFNFN